LRPWGLIIRIGEPLVYPFRHWLAGLACFSLLALVIFLANLVMRDTDNPFNGIWNVSSKPFSDLLA
jgi:hypothetical protein